MKIGIILTGDYSWAGGLYYSLNIIKLLQGISEKKKLSLVVFVNGSTGKELLDEIRLPNVQTVHLDHKSLLYKVWCKIMGLLTGSNYRFVSDINAEKLDLIYPLNQYDKAHKRLNCRPIYWLYDFQHKFLPELFTAEEIKQRDLNFRKVIDHARHIVVSSHDSKDHLYQFYPACKAKVDVYNFVSLLEKTQWPSPKLSGKNVPDKYLIVCNQFWPHKNHLTVLKAINELVKIKKSVFVIFTGKYDDARNATYVNGLREYISTNQLDPYLLFTGFIARGEQAALIAHANAVIQPSRFEGWSTVIEDAKALNKFLIVSDLPIHREQVVAEADFFKPGDFKQLSDLMNNSFSRDALQSKLDYQKNIEQSLKDLCNLFQIS